MVEINKILKSEFIDLNLTSENKNDAILELSKKFLSNGVINDLDEYIKVVHKREAESTTGIGFGIGIPHGKSNVVNYTSLAFGRSEKGIAYDSLDGKPVHLLFLIGVPEDSNDDHLKILSKLSRKLMHEEIRENLMNAENTNEIYNILN
ncbi:PTS sugar transporter subunit IIA [Alkalibacterium sp. m-11]